MKVPLSSKLPSPPVGEESRARLPSARRLAGKGEAAMTCADPHTRALRNAPPFPAFCLAPLLLLAGCAATQSAAAVQPQAPGFLLGLWHGFIFPVAWIVSLFMPDVAVFGQEPKFTLSACLAGSRRAVPNQGGWYDFGYFIGVVFLGAGARHARRH
jgi:hypothetical protein